MAFLDIPNGAYCLVNATVPDCLTSEPVAYRGEGLARADIVIEAGRIARILPAGAATPRDLALVDLDGGLVLPGLVDMHTHLDKGHIWPRKPNPDGTFAGALQSVAEDRMARWSASDVARRMDFALRSAFAHGTVFMRTHIDSIPPQDGISWPVFLEMRERWAGRIALQAVALFGIEAVADDGFLDRIARRVATCGGVLGSVTYMVDGLVDHLDRVFQTAARHGLDLDFHVDETLDPSAHSLRLIAEAALRNRFAGKVVCGHCCSLSTQDADEVERTLDAVAEAGLGIVALPMCNLYLQDRAAGRTPRFRGVTLLHELKARGVPVAVASDNTRDPFYAYGDLDMVEVYAQATRLLHLDHPVGDWIKTVTLTPAEMLGSAEAGRIEEMGAADLLLFRVRDWNELLARPGGERIVLRSGQPIDRTLPDYRELDDLME
ncbi:cytosine deaminase [Stappia sp. F7233]|uniref:Cytosine deaminase n=1 Tax=Stappia albiluteola TaxID=2758565 RepID=A0A839AFP5_9HYPH|nr:cytosine deaminase [Stappia albiluteola]MBA5777379.1 cytosine deaminase [Stappia albiluteola]